MSLPLTGKGRGSATLKGVGSVNLPDDFGRLQPLRLQALPGVHCDPVGSLRGKSGHLHAVAAFYQALLLIAVTHWGDDALHHFVLTLDIKEQI